MNEITGLKSIALGLRDGGGEIFANFPGYKSHELFTLLGGKTTSVNEKISYEITWGSSIAGKRSVVMFKNVGLNDAADPFLNSHLLKVNAGLVVVVFDDVEVEGSQSRQDSRNYFDFFGGLWLEPYSIQNAYDLAYKSFTWSEKFSLPIIIRVTNQLIRAKGEIKRQKKINKRKGFVKDNKKYVIHPINSNYQRKILAGKNKKINKFVEGLYKNSVEVRDLNIVVGCNLSEEKKFGLRAKNIFRIFTYPLPTKRLSKIVSQSKSLRIFEQGSKFCLEKIKANFSKKIEGFSGIIPDHSGGYIITKNYEKLFKAIGKIKNSVLVGDLGEYTKDSLNSINACLCFGSSISVGLGMKIASKRIKVFSIIGDAAYLHSGKNVIPEIIERNIPAKIIVVCNGGSQGTGGQEIPGDLYYQPKEVEIFRIKYDNTPYLKILETIRKMERTDKTTVLYIDMNYEQR